MENRHPKARDLIQTETRMMNEIKTKGTELGQLFEKLRSIEELDQRWVDIGATYIQTGLMALTRAIERPPAF